jgi:hypothetical protein
LYNLAMKPAGCLAETLYHVHRGSYDIYLDNSTSEEHREIIETARELITKHQLDSEGKGKHLNWLEYRALRKAIHAHPQYGHLGAVERWDD